MSYIDQSSRNRPAAIAAVAIIHLGIGYAIVSGLAYTVISHLPIITETQNYQDPKVPPPHDLPPPQRPTHETAVQPVQRIVQARDVEVQTVNLYPTDTTTKPPLDAGPPPAQDPPPPTKPNLSRAAQPGAGRTGWVTTDDYPPQPLRDGISGVVAISVQVGADGRVQGCAVTKSSGNAQLDDTTCRLYARRAHFQPALDAEGKPIASVQSDRIRWQVPQE